MSSCLRLLPVLASIATCLLFPLVSTAQETVFFRHLVYNHDSPYLPYQGTGRIAPEEVAGQEHYEFHYDESGRLTEIRNESSENWRRLPLTHLGAWRTSFAYEDNREIRRFYDREGNRVQNLRGVWEEEFLLAADGMALSLEFRDKEGKAMESSWGIARYYWEKKGTMVIERRWNLAGKLMPLSPYFAFHISGLVLDACGHPAIHYNLNDDLEVTENADGIAYYSDLYAGNGNLLSIAYHKKNGTLTPSPWEFALVRLAYDGAGNPVWTQYLRADGTALGTQLFRYDPQGKYLPEGQ